MLYLPRLFCETRNFIFCISHNVNDAYCCSIRISFFLFLHQTLIWHLGSFYQTTDTRKYFTDDFHSKVFSPWNAVSSLYKYLFFLFSIARKRIVCIASTTQTTAYLLACNYTEQLAKSSCKEDILRKTEVCIWYFLISFSVSVAFEEPYFVFTRTEL